jgi:hypothetical protein
VKAGEFNDAFKSNAVCVAFETGLFKSLYCLHFLNLPSLKSHLLLFCESW